MKDLIRLLDGAHLSIDDDMVVGNTSEGLPIVIQEQDGRIWLELTVYDEDMEDGREIEYEIRRI